jgi:hypothetical protein
LPATEFLTCALFYVAIDQCEMMPFTQRLSGDICRDLPTFATRERAVLIFTRMYTVGAGRAATVRSVPRKG